ncbi:MAG: hypothetical protein M1154_15270 [Gammaproteobacteria bacterium]|nr:hypothetical protein [Gammaproteobacteria bacterium]
MTQDDHQRVINELQHQATLARFKATDMDEELAEDDDKRLTIWTKRLNSAYEGATVGMGWLRRCTPRNGICRLPCRNTLH